jgi:hypothetical protein
MTYTENCNNNVARKNASCHITPGQPPVYSLDGKIYTKEQFDKAFPIAKKLRSNRDVKHLKGENIDSTTNWQE